MNKLPDGTKLGIAGLMRELDLEIVRTPSGFKRNLLCDCKTTIALLYAFAKEQGGIS